MKLSPIFKNFSHGICDRYDIKADTDVKSVRPWIRRAFLVNKCFQAACIAGKAASLVLMYPYVCVWFNNLQSLSVGWIQGTYTQANHHFVIQLCDDNKLSSSIFPNTTQPADESFSESLVGNENIHTDGKWVLIFYYTPRSMRKYFTKHHFDHARYIQGVSSPESESWMQLFM